MQIFHMGRAWVRVGAKDFLRRVVRSLYCLFFSVYDHIFVYFPVNKKNKMAAPKDKGIYESFHYNNTNH